MSKYKSYNYNYFDLKAISNNFFDTKKMEFYTTTKLHL